MRERRGIRRRRGDVDCYALLSIHVSRALDSAGHHLGLCVWWKTLPPFGNPAGHRLAKVNGNRWSFKSATAKPRPVALRNTLVGVLSSLGLGSPLFQWTSHPLGSPAAMLNFCLVAPRTDCGFPCQPLASVSLGWGERQAPSPSLPYFLNADLPGFSLWCDPPGGSLV